MTLIPRRFHRPAVEVGPLLAGARVGALSVPPWLLEMIRAGRVRISDLLIEVAYPDGSVATAGPNDVLVEVAGEVYVLRSACVEALFRRKHST